MSDRLAHFRATSQRPLLWLGIITTIGLFIVLAMGDLVTNANAAQGCGPSWPLCEGRLFPKPTPQALIEFSHRLVVAIVSIGILGLAIGTALRTPRRLETRILAPSLIVFLVLQSVLGGLAVLWPQSPPILALHLGISLISFATVLLTTLLLWGEDSTDRLRDQPFPSSFRSLTWFSMIYVYAVIYLGAFVRHNNAQRACNGWPLCNGSALPTLTPLIFLNFMHRVSVLVAFFLFLALLWQATRLRSIRPDFFWSSLAALVSLMLQALSGAYVALSGMALPAALLHGSLIALVFGPLSYLCLQVLPRGVSHAATTRTREVLRPSARTS
ncbi:MAG: COX15/CtaA family protein [Chloroflexi bacterium]|nr:COX15/CtaA family protein [Chloroflexota bacterium]